MGRVFCRNPRFHQRPITDCPAIRNWNCLVNNGMLVHFLKKPKLCMIGIKINFDSTDFQNIRGCYETNKPGVGGSNQNNY